jgi:hypothetical protein
MYLIQILLPLYDNEGQEQAGELFGEVRRQLTERFGGLTAYSRTPAQGLWKDEGKTHRDDIVVFEVMADELDRDWWGAYRRKLEEGFRQEEIVIRAQETLLL